MTNQVELCRNAKVCFFLVFSLACSFVGMFVSFNVSPYTEQPFGLGHDVLDKSFSAAQYNNSGSSRLNRNTSLIDIDWKELSSKEKKLKSYQMFELTMEKFFNSSPPGDFAFSDDTRIYFIHVGKAGGSSLYEKLGLKDNDLTKRIRVLKCHVQGHRTYDECFKLIIGGSPTRLFRATMGHRHLSATRYPIHTTRWLKNNVTMLLFTVRYPTARVVSAFNFHYQALEVTGKLHQTSFYKCFGSVEELAQAGGDYNVWISLKPTCQGQARGFLKGTTSFPGKHMHASFSYYAGQVWRPNRAVAAVRTEYLAQDVRNLEQRLGGNPDDLGEFQKEAKSKNFTLNGGLSPMGKRSVCCWIVEEISVFEKIIMLSENFDHNEKVSYIRNSRQDCGIDLSTNDHDDSNILAFSWKKWHQDTCPSYVPLKPWFERLF